MIYYAFGNVIVACEFGQRVNNRIGDEINDTIGEFDWYLFPDELKEIFPFVIQFAQRPIDFKFFGSYSCNRDVFKKVSLIDYFLFLYFIPVLIIKFLIGHQKWIFLFHGTP